MAVVVFTASLAVTALAYGSGLLVGRLRRKAHDRRFFSGFLSEQEGK